MHAASFLYQINGVAVSIVGHLQMFFFSGASLGLQMSILNIPHYVQLIYVIRIAQVNAIELGNLPGLLYSSRLIAPVVLQFKS
jgi:hypothetical protein